MMKKFTEFVKNNRAEFVLLVLILAAAAFLRLYKIADYLTFLGDEGRDVLVVKRMIVDHRWTLLGPTASVGGFFLGPIYYYFMIPFLWAFHLDPVGPAVMVALFGVATVFLVYRVGKEFFNFQTGLLAAALYAISPLVISFSRSSWNPNLMPFFSLLTLYLLWQSVIKKNAKLLFLVGFLMGITIQLHYLTVFLMVIVGVYFLLFSSLRFKAKPYLLMASGFLIGWSPFILFELRHHFPNFRSLFRFIFHGKETGFLLQKVFPIVSDVGFRLFNRLVANNQTILATLLLFGSLVAFIFFWWKQKGKAKSFATYSLVILWLVLGVFLFAFYQDDIYDYYFGFMFPLPFLLTAFALQKLSAKKPLGLFFSGLIIVLLVGVNLKGIPFRFQPNRQLAQTEQIASLMIEKAENRPYNFALITGSNSDHAYRYFLEIMGRPPVIIENPQLDPERKTVTDQLFVVCEMAECKPLGHSLWEIAGFGRAEIVGQWPAPGGITIIKLEHWQPKTEL